MLKTIKATKQMRLDELIKYVWDNGIKEQKFKANNQLIYPFKGGNNVTVNEDGKIYFGSLEKNMLSEKDTFTVEIEEPITEYTEFDCILEIRKGSLTHIRGRKTIKENLTEETERFYALIDGKLQLVWERDGE